MKVSKKILVFLIVVCVVSLISAFKNFDYKEDTPKGVKYEYAILSMQYGSFVTTTIDIVYSDGKVEDYKKMNHITTYDLTDHGTKIVIDCFNYLNQQNYELTSSDMSAGNIVTKVYYFSRKVSQ